MEEVEALFAKQKDAYEIEKMNHGEFDYMRLSYYLPSVFTGGL